MPHQIDFGGAFFIESIINDFSLKITGNHSVGKISSKAETGPAVKNETMGQGVHCNTRGGPGASPFKECCKELI